MKRDLNPKTIQSRSRITQLLREELEQSEFSRRRVAQELGVCYGQVQRWMMGEDPFQLADVLSLPAPIAKSILSKLLSTFETDQSPQQLRDRLVVIAGKLTEAVQNNDAKQVARATADATAILLRAA